MECYRTSLMVDTTKIYLKGHIVFIPRRNLHLVPGYIHENIVFIQRRSLLEGTSNHKRLRDLVTIFLTGNHAG